MPIYILKSSTYTRIKTTDSKKYEMTIEKLSRDKKVTTNYNLEEIYEGPYNNFVRGEDGKNLQNTDSIYYDENGENTYYFIKLVVFGINNFFDFYKTNRELFIKYIGLFIKLSALFIKSNGFFIKY